MSHSSKTSIALFLFFILSISLSLQGFSQILPASHGFPGKEIRSAFYENYGNRQMLYNQAENPSAQGGVISQFFTDYPLYTCQAADDFFVSGGTGWLLQSIEVLGFYSVTPPGGPASRVNLFIYADEAGSPGTEIETFFNIPVTESLGGNLLIDFPVTVELPQNHYWISVQPVMNYSSAGMWYWAKQAAPTIHNEFHWKNPGGGFGLPGTGNWTVASSIWTNQGFTDWNLGFILFGTSAEFPPAIISLSTNSPYPGQNVRLYGHSFGEFNSNCAVMVDGNPIIENITFWSENEVFFNFPTDNPPLSQISVIGPTGFVSNMVEVAVHIPDKCFFITPSENKEISENSCLVSVSAEIRNELIAVTRFYYQPEGATDWIFIGQDNDGTAKTVGTTSPLGSGDGWAINWDVTGIDFLQLTLKAEMTDIFGHVLTGERPVVIDKTPLIPAVDSENSKLFGGQAIDNDSLKFEIEIKDESTNLVEFEWAPPPAPIGGWDYEREVDSIIQTEVEFVDANGNDVSDGACGPCAMASCLKWLAQQYPGSTTASTSVEELAKKLASEAGTSATGTRDDNLAAAAENQLENDPGISDDFDVERHFNKPSGKNGTSHNVYHDIAGGLRDSADVVMLIYQVDANGDTLGHYVTASSHHTHIGYVSGDFGCAAVQTSYVDFMDPATGEKEVKIITWYTNPPQIQDYDLKPDAPGEAWVHEVITIKPKKENKDQGKNGTVASFPVNGAGMYQFSLPCSTLPEGVQMIGVLGVNPAGEKRGEYFACANGQYDVVAGFTVDHTTWIPGFPLHFNNFSSPSSHITEYWWDFGDGNFSTGQNPDHVYQNPGIFNVKLAVTDGAKTDTLTRESYIQIVPATEQEIVLFEGWNGLSGYVAMVDSLIENLMAPVADNLVIMKNFHGVYWPDEEINTLQYWHDGAGFYIKLSADEVFTLKGMGTVDKMLALQSGWGFLPVLSPCTIAVTDISSQLSGNLTLIKEISGNRVFWPAVGVATLTTLEPGKAYLIHLAGEASVAFPECEKQLEMVLQPDDLYVENAPDILKTPFSHLICFENPGEFLSENAKAIGVFNNKGRCCGFAGIHKGSNNLVITAFGDDPLTALTDGLIEGEAMHFRILLENGKFYDLHSLSFDENLPDKNIFTINGISKIREFKTGFNDFSSNFKNKIFVYPNPATDYLMIEGFDGEFQIEISNTQGRSVLKQNINAQTKNDVSSLKSGLYFIRITSHSNIFTEKILIR